MSNMFQIVALSILATILMACASQGPVTGRPAITLTGLTLSKEVIQQGNTAVPKKVSSEFQTTDKGVAALVSFKNMFGSINLRWDWFGPDGNLFLTKRAKTVRSNESKYFQEFSAWHVLTIAGDKVEKMPGHWVVKVYLNDELLIYKTFTIVNKTYDRN